MTSGLLTPGRIDREAAECPTDRPAALVRRNYGRQTAWATTILAVLAGLSAAYLGRAILLPVALAILLNLALTPIVVYLQRHRVPPAVSAAFILAGFLAAVVVTVMLLWTPAQNWITQLPEARHEIVEKLRPLRKPVDQLNEASKEVEKMAAGENEREPLRVQVEQPGLASAVLNTSGTLIASSVILLALLYFLLARGDRFVAKIVAASPTWRDKRNVVALASEIQRSISLYLFTITLINIGLGATIGAAMWAIDLPNPALWGVMACMLNYIPFVGAAIGSLVVFAVALLEFPLGHALLAPAAYVAVNIIEANFVTPALLGRSTSLNPVAILLSLTLWGWMWGVGGGLPCHSDSGLGEDHLRARRTVARFRGPAG